jgi:hypothetical protein
MGSLQSAPMEPASPARLYATVAGAVLFVGGIVGFFFDLSWLNYLHLASGAIVLLLAGAAPRFCALALGLTYTVLAAWDLPDPLGWAHLAIGLLGLAALAGTSKARAQTAAESA